MITGGTEGRTDGRRLCDEAGGGWTEAAAPQERPGVGDMGAGGGAERALRPSLGEGPVLPARPRQALGLQSRHGARSCGPRSLCAAGRRQRGAGATAAPRPAHGWQRRALLRPSPASGEPCSPWQLRTHALSSLLQHRGARPGVSGGDECPHSPRDEQPRPASGPLCVSVQDCGKITGLGPDDLVTNPGPSKLCHEPWPKVVRRV